MRMDQCLLLSNFFFLNASLNPIFCYDQQAGCPQNFSFMDFHDLRGSNRVADSYGVTNSVEVYDDSYQDGQLSYTSTLKYHHDHPSC